MELTFLGTSSGTPTKSRNVSALALREKHKKTWCLVDCGEGTQHQILHTNFSLLQLQLICITHVHGDHCYGLPGLLSSASMLGRTKKLQIIGPLGIKKMIEVVLSLSDSHLSFEIEFHETNQLNAEKLECDFTVETIKLSHRVPSFAYAFTAKSRIRKLDVLKLQKHQIPAGPIWGQLQKGHNVIDNNGETIIADDYVLPMNKPHKIIVGGDNDQPNRLVSSAKDADVVIHEATYTSEVAAQIGPGPQHSCAKRVAQFAQNAGIKNLILTHFSPRYLNNTDKKPSIQDIESEAKQYFSGQLFLANDFDVFTLDKRNILTRVHEKASKVLSHEADPET